MNVAAAHGRTRWIAPLVGVAIVVLAVGWFAVPWPMAIASLVAAIALAVVCARIAAETDVVPTGAVGKLVQLGIGITQPHAVLGNLMATSAATGSAASCADALTDLRCASLLGAPPGRQMFAQAFGVIVGAIVVVPVFTLVVEPSALGTSTWPAPAAQAWRAVAMSLRAGWQPAPGVTTAMAIGAVLGLVLPRGARVAARRARATWVPSGPAIALGFLFPPGAAWSFAIGGWIAARRIARHPDASAKIALLGAGAIVGESAIAITSRIVEALSR
jgi:uncharacterized oligopeptide transporter (OPT) family protein